MKEKCFYCESNDATTTVQLNGLSEKCCDTCTKLLRDPMRQDVKTNFILKFQEKYKDELEAQMEPNKKEVDLLVDLTAKTFPPVKFRDDELKRITQLLLRKDKNNPVIIGEPGTGKTAVVEHFAMMVKNGEIPRLEGYKVYSLNPGSITSGTKFRGDLEQKLEKIIKRVTEEDCILFIDEIHLLTSSNGENDSNIANLMKPYLARGEMKLIGATTLNEYRRIEKDAAFSRRLQAVRLKPLNADQTLDILRDIKPVYEKFHSVRMDEDALSHIVKLSDKYLKDKHFPDKAIDILDEAMSRASIDQQVTLSQKEKEKLKLSFKSFATTAGVDEAEMADLLFKMDQVEIDSMVSISKEEINSVVELMTGIPLRSLEKQDKDKLRNFAKALQTKVIGQSEATDALSRTVKRSSLKLTNKTKPTVLFFAGPTGVGKTEAVKVLTSSLFGNEDSLLRFDMSEYMEKHTVSRLVGSPPGYIGHDDEGQLTEAVRRNPFSVILLDEFEKAHPDVSKIFLQVFDDGRLTDSKGRVVDFSNTIIVATSNIGSAKRANTVGFSNSSVKAVENNDTLIALKAKYPPEFLNRLDEIITFKELSEEDLLKIVDLRIDQLKQSLAEQNINIQLTADAKKLLAKKGYEPSMGARPLNRVITREIEDLLIDHLLENDSSLTIKIKVSNDKLVIA